MINMTEENLAHVNIGGEDTAFCDFKNHHCNECRFYKRCKREFKKNDNPYACNKFKFKRYGEFRNGKFTDEGITLQEKIDKLIRISVEQLGMPEETARQMAETKLPQLKRWKKEN